MGRKDEETITPGRAARLLLVTGLYPTPELPVAGVFVQQRVAMLRSSGISVDVVSARSYRRSAVRRYVGMCWEAVTRTQKIDGVEAHVAMPAGLIGVIAAARHRVPCLVYAHGSDVSFTAWRHPVLTALTRAVLRRASAVVANSAWTADWLRRLGCRDPHIVPPGVDFTLFAPDVPEREALDLPDGNLALFVGNRVAHKGVDLFVSGVLAAPGWRGVMVGDGPVPTGDPRILVRGPVDPVELARYYRSVTCLVTPSRREGLGLAAIEALASGTPVVSSGVGGLADIVVDGQNGVVMVDATEQAVAAALARVQDIDFEPEFVRESVRRHDVRTVTGEMAAIWATLIESGPMGRTVSSSG
jgi:glycosyltransferase involved in cell wall biosynthesis